MKHPPNASEDRNNPKSELSKRYAYDSQKEKHPELFEDNRTFPPDAGCPSAGCLPLLFILGVIVAALWRLNLWN